MSIRRIPGDLAKSNLHSIGLHLSVAVGEALA